MHEYSIAYDVFMTSRRAAHDNSASRVKKIYVDIGELAMVNPDQVAFLFRTLCEDDELFCDADLVFNPVKTRTRCRCGYEGPEKYICPRCGALPEIVAGREIVVTNIEIEVDDS